MALLHGSGVQRKYQAVMTRVTLETMKGLEYDSPEYCTKKQQLAEFKQQMRSTSRSELDMWYDLVMTSK